MKNRLERTRRSTGRSRKKKRYSWRCIGTGIFLSVVLIINLVLAAEPHSYFADIEIGENDEAIDPANYPNEDKDSPLENMKFLKDKAEESRLQEEETQLSAQVKTKESTEKNEKTDSYWNILCYGWFLELGATIDEESLEQYKAKIKTILDSGKGSRVGISGNVPEELLKDLKQLETREKSKENLRKEYQIRKKIMTYSENVSACYQMAIAADAVLEQEKDPEKVMEAAACAFNNFWNTLKYSEGEVREVDSAFDILTRAGKVPAVVYQNLSELSSSENLHLLLLACAIMDVSSEGLDKDDDYYLESRYYAAWLSDKIANIGERKSEYRVDSEYFYEKSKADAQWVIERWERGVKKTERNQNVYKKALDLQEKGLSSLLADTRAEKQSKGK